MSQITFELSDENKSMMEQVLNSNPDNPEIAAEDYLKSVILERMNKCILEYKQVRLSQVGITLNDPSITDEQIDNIISILS